MIQVIDVDDDADFADLAATLLQREDERFAVITASDAPEWLERLWKDNLDDIVSGFDMPGQNDLVFHEAVRMGITTISSILSTGKGNEEIASQKASNESMGAQ